MVFNVFGYARGESEDAILLLAPVTSCFSKTHVDPKKVERESW